MGGAGSLVPRVLCHETDEGDFLRFLQGQDAIFIFQQHRPLLGSFSGQ